MPGNGRLREIDRIDPHVVPPAVVMQEATVGAKVCLKIPPFTLLP